MTTHEPPLDWLPIYWAANMVEAELLAGMLRSQGFAAGVRTNSTASGVGELPVDVLQTAVWAAPDDAELARAQLDQYDNSNGQDWLCTQCGETNGPAFDACWSCGEERR